MERIDGHLRVWEYDGAYKCLDCQAQWGALTGHPTMPELCERKVPLKPCPFCGGEAALGTSTIKRWKDIHGNYGEFTGHSVNCIMCGSTNRGIAEGFQTPEKATEHWNRRT